jgi:hypothetical protein
LKVGADDLGRNIPIKLLKCQGGVALRVVVTELLFSA